MLRNVVHNTSPVVYLFGDLFTNVQMLNKFYVGQLSEPEENPGFLDITTCKELHVKKCKESLEILCEKYLLKLKRNFMSKPTTKRKQVFLDFFHFQ